MTRDTVVRDPRHIEIVAEISRYIVRSTFDGA